MNKEERLYKLDNGSDTARWAANHIRALDAKLFQVMEEYCPDEISCDQWVEFEEHQKVVDDPRRRVSDES